MLKKKHIYLFLCISGLLITIGSKAEHRWPFFFQNYWNDLIIMPMVFKTCSIILKKIHGQTYVIPIPYLLIGCAYFSILFEIIFPLFLERYTADFFDIILYFLGGFLYYLIEYDTYKMS